MLSYKDCPHLPETPTMDGKPMPAPCDSKPVLEYEFDKSGSVLKDAIAIANDFKEGMNIFIQEGKQREGFPVLSSIGLLDALREVEKVVAWNKTEKHADCKWKRKSIDYHDAKAVKHLSTAQCEAFADLPGLDDETDLSHRAHAACRVLMSLALELRERQFGSR